MLVTIYFYEYLHAGKDQKCVYKWTHITNLIIIDAILCILISYRYFIQKMVRWGLNNAMLTERHLDQRGLTDSH